jgi:hypothetical protein
MYSSIDSSRIINLKVISKLKRGEKLNTRLHRFTIDGSYFHPRFLFRWLNSESRDQTIDAIDALVTSCVCQEGTANEELVEQLIQTAKGIGNLQSTYNEDQTTCAGIEMILEKIEHFVVTYHRSIHLTAEVQLDIEEIELD